MTTKPTPTAQLLEQSRPRRASRRVLVALALGGALAVGGLAFAVGRITAPAAAATFPGAEGQPPGGLQGPGGQGQGPGGFGGFGGGGLGVEGTITALDGDTLTLESADGSSITVNLSADTSFAREESAAQQDIAEGDEVRIEIDLGTGTDPGSGEVDASSVTLVQP